MEVKSGINEPLLRECVSAIENDPESWDQNYWEHNEGCKTTRCLAGWAIYLTHPEMPVLQASYARAGSRSHGAVFEYAAELLGFSELVAEKLFMAYFINDLPSFKRRITYYTGVEFKEEEQ